MGYSSISLAKQASLETSNTSSFLVVNTLHVAFCEHLCGQLSKQIEIWSRLIDARKIEAKDAAKKHLQEMCCAAAQNEMGTEPRFNTREESE